MKNTHVIQFETRALEAVARATLAAEVRAGRARRAVTHASRSSPRRLAPLRNDAGTTGRYRRGSLELHDCEA